jgi:chorismate dehydratase
LVRILLRQRFGLSPALKPLPIGTEAVDADADAVLLIGDRAIHPPEGVFLEQWDLGSQWCRWAGLPFVFAMWTARPGIDTRHVTVALEKARDAGLVHLAEIAQTHAASVGLAPDECLVYLRDNLYFHLGRRERRGLELFRRLAAELGLAPAKRDGTDLQFHGCQTP